MALGSMRGSMGRATSSGSVRDQRTGGREFTKLLIFIDSLLYANLESFCLLRLELIVANVIGHFIIKERTELFKRANTSLYS